ncbi:diguanylate cyclase [Campylobacter fetus]|uniref:diguanylate cyclase n=5 Tax=Campylobacter fetus TaxID=196 RepID=A0A5L8U7J7_CAMFE|nr:MULTISPECIES: diguanylate cyclase [Campylobacter]OCS22805.1 diguanylate cyclase response regulator [Campylobacter fetus subsp. venerealis cfvi97/532]OCS26160.1 diguanylate cyclase response regulator [Campylobacter fetus subsp. venerealis cfvB10]OCS29743.1 diguanylate cyclase response regulator [Campylobacter fetus subsp. venerealis LMG 6570 = CCUG 33900]ABK82671.1 diguanylate cyclase [Campylobacter fetus subsp. fetus 82-40]AHE94494.1 bile resistance regulator [Campylobacter fetus subsp. ven
MKERVLIVDDNKALARLIAKKMENNVDMDIVVAHTFNEARDIVDDNDDFFIALLDLNLPDAPNGEIVDYIISKNILVIVLTGSIDSATKDIFMNKNIVDYVVKSNMNNIDYIFDSINRLSKNRYYKVMVVDDSTPMRNKIKQILLSQQFKVFAAAHGEEAMSYLADNPDIKLVLTDYNMPVMDGFELMGHIREKYSKNDLSVIAITGDGKDADTGAKFLKNGANDFIVKPFSKEELVCRVNNSIEFMENIKFMAKLANTDFLSGAYSRRYFYMDMKEYYKNCSDQSFAVAMFDIDDFKKINDKFGHDIGDIIIQKLSSFLIGWISEGDLVARFGGEEFCVVLKNINFDDAVKKAVSIRAKIASSLINIKGFDIKFTVSIGVTNGDFSKNIDHIISKADEALYNAKIAGKNRVEIL